MKADKKKLTKKVLEKKTTNNFSTKQKKMWLKNI